jgi:transcriptional regulator with XRE-family HTH domain
LQTRRRVCQAVHRITEGDRRVAANLRRLRLAAGVPLREIGEALGVSLQSIRKFETGAHRVSAGQLPTLAMCLGVPVDALFAAEGDPGVHIQGLRALTLSRNFQAIEDDELQVAVLALSRALVAAAERRRNAGDRMTPTASQDGA